MLNQDIRLHVQRRKKAKAKEEGETKKRREREGEKEARESTIFQMYQGTIGKHVCFRMLCTHSSCSISWGLSGGVSVGYFGAIKEEERKNKKRE